jgi:hypothetical protein
MKTTEERGRGMEVKGPRLWGPLVRSTSGDLPKKIIAFREVDFRGPSDSKERVSF